MMHDVYYDYVSDTLSWYDKIVKLVREELYKHLKIKQSQYLIKSTD